VASILDNELGSQSPQMMQSRLDEVMLPLDIARIELALGDKIVFSDTRPESYGESTFETRARQADVPLIKHTGMTMHLNWQASM
ncbi:RNase E specificity factor CsrD, partial [Cronobacter sakazakii]